MVFLDIVKFSNIFSLFINKDLIGLYELPILCFFT